MVRYSWTGGPIWVYKICLHLLTFIECFLRARSMHSLIYFQGEDHEDHEYKRYWVSICWNTQNFSEGPKGAWPGRRKENLKSPMKMKRWTPHSYIPLSPFLNVQEQEWIPKAIPFTTTPGPKYNFELGWIQILMDLKLIQVGEVPLFIKKNTKTVYFFKVYKSIPLHEHIVALLSCVPQMIFSSLTKCHH